ncbi:unnamed protein product [Ostreobium quekettii]|uniref:4Fe-4S ferredoxin-type domain-containing protein n=1 Tax=Ostreobium quekettii TaxID=121088 RepID=A0A8S1IQA1_9CHLO|nr:unnamed protein product [Ostreobium quekettii]|eukprot:evm.model.scf_1432.2 EVM.evm.TU.scf_1432.2   scf_1432:3927-5972(+)
MAAASAENGANGPTSMDAVLLGLGARLHLDRVKAQEQLSRGLDTESWADDPKTQAALVEAVRKLMQSETPECRLGGLQAAGLLLPYVAPSEFDDFVLSGCWDMLEDPEVRIRLAVGDCLGALVKKAGVSVYNRIGSVIVKSIRDHLDRENEGGEEGVDDRGLCSPRFGFNLDGGNQPGTGSFRHDTEGWKCLETSFKALQKVMGGCGRSFAPLMTPDLRDLLYLGLGHFNRFVRETGFLCLGTMCEMLGPEGLGDIKSEVAQKLAKGLADNWSQVRYAASIATRTFLEVLGSRREEVYADILPQMCLNRYYVAEGVKLYSQQTWRLMVSDHGREWVQRLMPHFVDYYIRQCGANNHAVREAACACIAELMMKIGREAVGPYVPRLLLALVDCFKDASWPVRDAACTACGNCVSVFPEESRVVLDELYDLWFAHLWDNIGSVRENTAIALGKAVQAYGEEALSRLLPVLKERLAKAKEQPEHSSQFSDLENTTTFGVAGRRVPDAHVTDQQMFSCGSLAPKLARGGGCMDHGFKREKQPWEASDGAVYLVRELSAVVPSTAAECMPALADLSRLGGFMHCAHLHETVWKAVPTIAANMGKRAFKPHLADLLDSMFLSLKADNQLEAVAAGEAIGAVRDMLGPNIFRGRLTDEQCQMLDTNHNVPPAGTRSNLAARRNPAPVH